MLTFLIAIAVVAAGGVVLALWKRPNRKRSSRDDIYPMW